MIIDIHGHLWLDNYEENKKEILKACEEYNIERIYVSSLGPYYPDLEEIETLNNLTLSFMKENPDTVGGFVLTDPVHDKCVDILQNGIDNGMAGVKVWVSAYADDERMDPIAKKCIDLDVPILIHAFHKAVGQIETETTGVHVRNLALKFPKLKILMAHLGGNAYHGLRCIEDLDNVYTDFSGTIIRNDDIEYAVELLGADRVLFGTDMPAGGQQCIGQVEGANLTKEEKDKIYYKNALTILGGRR